MIVLTLVAALLSAGTQGEVVARVDGRVISSDALTRRLASESSRAYRERPDLVLSTMIDEDLLGAEGHRVGLDGSEIAKARFDLLQRQEAGALFLRREIDGKVAPDRKMLENLFHSTADAAAFELLA